MIRHVMLVLLALVLLMLISLMLTDDPKTPEQEMPTMHKSISNTVLREVRLN